MNIVGLKYPVRSVENSEIVGYRTVKNAVHCQNRPCIIISLFEDELPNLLVDYAEALQVENMQAQLESKTNFDSKQKEDTDV